MHNFLLLLSISVILGLTAWYFRRSEHRREFVQQRLHAITVGKDNSEPSPRLSVRKIRRAASPGGVFHLPRTFAAQLDAALEATGNRLKLWHLIFAGLIAALVLMLFASRILALTPTFITLFGGMAVAVAPVALLHTAQSRYKNHFLDVFPDALDLVGRGVKAGLPVNEALAAAGREIADPVGSELRRALDQVQIGVQMIDALQQVADRVRAADFRFMVVALALQAKTGGSLAETLANLSGVVRARKALRLKARSLTAEAKASAAVLAVLPFLIGGYMCVINRDFGMMLWTDPRGRFMLGVAFLSLVGGLTTMYLMVKRALR
jgi:tight adherence protein B